MTKYGRYFAVSAVALTLLGGRSTFAQSPTASAAHIAEAGTHFRRGVTLYKDSDFAGALVEFKRAYDLAPNWRVLYNIGQAYYQLQRYAQALQAFNAYLTQGGTHLTPARRTAVEKERNELETRVGKIEIAVNVDGADIRVDDELVGTSPLPDALLVSVGHRRVTVAKEGRVALERFVDIAAGDRVKVSLEFPPEVVPSPVPTPSSTETPSVPPAPRSTAPETHQEPPSPRPVPWVPWAVTAAFVCATTAVGVVTLNQKALLTKQLDTYPGDPNAIDSARSRAKALAIADDILLGATAVSAGVALWLTVSRGEETGATVNVGVGPRGLLVRGEF